MTALANSILSSTEFSQKYGTLTNTEFVEQIYQNALGRNATMSELANWLGQLATGTATQATVVEAVLESAEHIADGDVYQVTNNTYNTSGTYTLIIPPIRPLRTRSFRTSTRPPSADRNGFGLATYSAALLNGTMTETQIAAALIGTSEFLTEYGSLSSADFVSQIFVTGLAGSQPRPRPHIGREN